MLIYLAIGLALFSCLYSFNLLSKVSRLEFENQTLKNVNYGSKLLFTAVLLSQGGKIEFPSECILNVNDTMLVSYRQDEEKKTEIFTLEEVKSDSKTI